MKFSELVSEYKPEATPEQIQRGLDFFENKEAFSKGTNFRIVYGDKYHDCLSKPCHADMAHAEYWTDKRNAIKDRALIATDNSSYRVYKSQAEREEIHGKYLQWLTKESHMKDYFLSDDDLHYNSGFLISADIPSCFLQNILISTRFFSECTEGGFKVFNQLYDDYGGDFAYHVVSGSNLSLIGTLPKFHHAYSTQGEKAPDFIVVPRTWHTVTPLFRNKDHLHNYLRGDAPKLKNKKETHYMVKPNLYGGSRLWGEAHYGQSFISEFAIATPEVIAEIKKVRKTPVDVVVDPFKQSRPRTSEPGYNQFLWSEIRDIILPAFKDKGLLNA